MLFWKCARKRENFRQFFCLLLARQRKKGAIRPAPARAKENAEEVDEKFTKRRKFKECDKVAKHIQKTLANHRKVKQLRVTTTATTAKAPIGRKIQNQ